MKEFASIELHDSRLVRMNCERSDVGSYRIVFDLEIVAGTPSEARYVSGRLEFRDVTYCHVEADLLFLADAGGAIQSGESFDDSPFLDRGRAKVVSNEVPSKLKHYRLELCPPAGRIDVIAESYSFTKASDA